jgi:uncharacterized LabA/DUF88 family protein
MIIVYIDAANLHKESKSLGFKINYKNFIVWLRQKYKADKIYLFIGFIPKYKSLYKNLEGFGYILIFKETFEGVNGNVKGNCDAELVLKVCNDFYEKDINYFILVTGDGDFKCLVDFLIENNSRVLLIAPNYKKFSALLKKSKSEVLDLNDYYHKFSKLLK